MRVRVPAIVLNAKGTIEVQPSGAVPFHLLTAQDNLRDGVSIRTGEDGRLRLALLPNALIQLRDRSELKIVTLRLAKDGDETDGGMTDRQAEVELLTGRLYAVHERRDDATAHLVISTPHGRLTADADCLYRIDVDEGRTRVSCARGAVLFSPAGGGAAESLSAGFVGRWPSETGRNIDPADDARAKGELESARLIENDLLVARRQIRNILPH